MGEPSKPPGLGLGRPSLSLFSCLRLSLLSEPLIQIFYLTPEGLPLSL